jgi:hypothetical protein
MKQPRSHGQATERPARAPNHFFTSATSRMTLRSQAAHDLNRGRRNHRR